MVPVPEELAGEVERFLMIKSLMSGVEGLDRESIARMLPLLNVQCRSVFSAIVAAKLSNSDLSIADLAGTLRWTEHETVGAVHELCQLLWAVFGSVIVVGWNLPPDGGQGAVDWSKQLIFATDEVADAFVAAERLLSKGETG